MNQFQGMTIPCRKSVKVLCLTSLTYSLTCLELPVNALAVDTTGKENENGIREQLVQNITTITGISLQSDENQGLRLFLETPTGKEPQTFRTSYGETLVIDLINIAILNESGKCG